jgi:hypothetical protein
VARLEVVGAHAVGDLEAEIEARELGEQVVEVGLVDVDELVEDVEAGRAELALVALEQGGEVLGERGAGAWARRAGCRGWSCSAGR